MDSLTKIKLKENNNTEIHLSSESATTEKDTVVRSKIDRHPDFDKAMQALVDEVVSVCRLPAEYREGMTVTGVSISFNETQGEGATITAQKSLPCINSPLVINTPHLHDDPDMLGLSAKPRTMDDKLRKLVNQARQFLNGKSAQGDLFEEESKESEAA